MMATERIYKVFIVPASEDEREFEDCGYEEAVELNNTTDSSGQEFTFNSEREREIFIQGYKAGIGWMGDGMYLTTEV